MISHLERNAGLGTARDLPDQRLDKLAAMLGSVGLGDGDISLIAEFMSLPRGTRYPPLDLSPQRKKERILGTLLRQFEGLARRRPFRSIEDLPLDRPNLSRIARSARNANRPAPGVARRNGPSRVSAALDRPGTSDICYLNPPQPRRRRRNGATDFRSRRAIIADPRERNHCTRRWCAAFR